MRARLIQLVLLTSSAALTGCALNRELPGTATANAAATRGTVHGGQQPVSGATITVWLAGTSGYGTGATVLATTTTDASGSFAFTPGSYTCPDPNAPVYLTAQGGDSGGGVNANLMLAAGLGSCASAPSASVDLSEVTTVATAYALSHFFTTSLGGDPTTDLIGGPSAAGSYNPGLSLANSATIPMLADLPSGSFNQSTGVVTLESAKLYSIANTLAACVNSTGQTSTSETSTTCGQLFAWTTPPGGTRPADTLQAAVQMALYPYQNVASLFNLAPPKSPYVGLSGAPNDWTVAVSYTSPTLGLGISGTATSSTSSNLDIDAGGRVWFPTNAAAAHGLAYFDPATQSFNGPYATALTQPQYVAIDTEGIVWGSDLSVNQIAGVQGSSPAIVTTLTTAAGGVTGPLAVTPGSSGDGLLFSSTVSGTSALWSELGGTLTSIGDYAGTPTGMASFTLGDPSIHEGDVASSASSGPCRLEAQSTNASYSKVLATTANPCASGGVAQLSPANGESVAAASTLNELCSYNFGGCFTPSVPLSSPQGIAVDGDAQVWIANAGDGSVSVLKYAYATGTPADYSIVSPVAYKHGSADGATMTAPYGLAIDRSGNVWVSNASCVTSGPTACTPSGFTLSELIGAAAPTITPLASSVVGVTVGTRPQVVTGVHRVAAQAHGGRGGQK